MTDPDPIPRDEPTASAVLRLEALCDDHEAALASGTPTRIEDRLVPPDDPIYEPLLRELLVLEVTYRRRLGERPTPAEYLARFPDRADAIRAALGPETAVTAPAPSHPRAEPIPRDGLPDIPGFAILGELGRGGMGVVYQARSAHLNRLVALKMILSGDLAGPEAAARFRAEAETVARLQHPEVVQIFGLGEYRGHPFLEMEYVAGGSLADRLEGTPWPPRLAARLVAALAGAVHHAHLRGIVHRDLKPANILLTPEGSPKVSDFGLAKSLGDEAGLTRTSSIIGSPSYMAPEQARGLTHLVGPGTDVYALGAILYELLTGRPPFRAPTVLATLEQVKGAEPPAPCRLQPGLSIDIETITLKCLVKEPSRRYASAAELADDLVRFDGGQPVRARPIGWAGRSAKWARRRPATASLAVASTLSVILLIAVLTRANLAARHQQRIIEGALERESAVRRQLADANARLAEQQRLTQQALERTTVALGERDSDLQRERLASYWEKIALVEVERRDGRSAEAARALDSCPEDLRNWEWRFLRRGGTPSPLAGHGGEVWDAAFSPDGRTVATASFDRTVRTWDRATGAPKQTLEGHTERVYSVAFNRDGTELVSASADRTAIVWDLLTGRPRLTLSGHTDNVRCAVYNPDGGMIATGSWDGTLRLWSRTKGDALRTCHTRVGYITRLAFSPDGLRVVAGGSDGSAEVWDYVRGRRLQDLPGHPGPVLGVAFSPDGLSVATASNQAGRGLIHVWEVATGLATLTLRDDAGLIERVVFSPDGRRLASSGWNGTVSLWDARSGRLGLVLRGHSDRVWGLNFSPSGDALATASADGKALIWEAGHLAP